MSKTILIGLGNKFSANASKWLFSVTGLLFLAQGISHIYAINSEPFGIRIIFGVVMLIGGLFYIFSGIFGFSESSKFASKVKIDESIIELKNSLWKSGKKLKWENISTIKFQPYEIIFELQGTSNSFSYNSNPDVSKSIKETIREFAARKNIEITGG